MRIPLVGPSAEARSLTADAQLSINMYTESGGSKSPKGFYGKPGIRNRKTLGGTCTALAAVNGRLFATAANTLKEINSSWATVQTITGITTSTTPVTQPDSITLNGEVHNLQVLIVANGFAYYWQDGAGVVATALTIPALAGHVDTDGVLVHNNGLPEDLFSPADMPNGTTIVINSVGYTVDYVIGPYDLVLTATAGTQSAVAFSAGPFNLSAGAATFLNGFAIITRPGTRQFNVSKLNDFSTFDPLDFALKETGADLLVSSIAHRGELWLFGAEDIEVWSPSANPDFPFVKNPSGAIRRGLGGARTLAKLGDTVLCFIGDDGVAYRTQGYSLVRISTPAQENDWRSEFDGAIAFGYTMQGHQFWQINLSTKTWVYDLTEQEWTLRGLLNVIAGNTFFQDVPRCHQYVQEWNGGRVGTDEGGTHGTHVVSGNNDSKLYEMSTDFHDDDGTAIRYVRRFAHICQEKMRLFLHRIVIELETGTAAGGDPEPLLELRISADGGKTWRQAAAGGDLIVKTGLGLNADSLKRVIFRELGSGRDLVPEIAVTMKAKLYIADAYGEITQGNQ